MEKKLVDNMLSMGCTCPYTLSLLRHKAHVIRPIINDVLTLGTRTKEKRKKVYFTGNEEERNKNVLKKRESCVEK
jgi:hypothetical protein